MVSCSFSQNGADEDARRHHTLLRRLEIEPEALDDYTACDWKGRGPLLDISDAGEPGMYTFTPINLWMPGIWTVSIDVVDDGSAESDKAVYNFCLSE